MPAEPWIRRKHTADKKLLWQDKKLPCIQHSGWETWNWRKRKGRVDDKSEMIIGGFPDARKVMHLHTRWRLNKCLWTTLHCQRYHEIESFPSDGSMGYTILCAVSCHCRRWDLKLHRWISPGAYSYLPSLVNKMDGNAGIHPCNKYRCIANNGTENTQLQAENNISGRYLKSIIKKRGEISALQCVIAGML